jgi:short-subunit dehydrogenase
MKKAIVIGGSSGIGKAVVEILLSNNYLVGLSGIKRDDLTDLQNANDEHLVIKYIDCSKENCSIEINELVETLGGLDLLVFTAGIGHLNKDLGYQVENQANKVNVLGFTEVADWSYRFFDRQRAGHFVAISSIAGLFGFRETPAYTAAKGYQINYLEALRQKAHKSKHLVYVTDIRSGFVDTDISKDLKRFWVATPEKAAKQIYRAIKRRPGVRYVTRRWQIMAVVIKLMPDWVRGRL